MYILGTTRKKQRFSSFTTNQAFKKFHIFHNAQVPYLEAWVFISNIEPVFKQDQH